MKGKGLRHSIAIFPIGTVIKLTDLTAHQIRYYENQDLIIPEGTPGNRRMYSLNDMGRLFEIKDFLNEGLNTAAIKYEYTERQDKAHRKRKSSTDVDVCRILQDELRGQGRFSAPSQYTSN